ncbi:hypothetical protein BHM03_00013754 [Ensete ventricosum]|nr:hypothetical protein BHM03_00013754 [Ensete ventricosum]
MYVHKPKDTDKHEHFIKHLVYILTVTVRGTYRSVRLSLHGPTSVRLLLRGRLREKKGRRRRIRGTEERIRREEEKKREVPPRRYAVVALARGRFFSRTSRQARGERSRQLSVYVYGLAKGEALKKKERAFEEEGELGEPLCELVSTPFFDFDLASPFLDDPDPTGNGKESCKEEDLEVQQLGEAVARAAEDVVSIASSTTLQPCSWPKVGDVCGLCFSAHIHSGRVGLLQCSHSLKGARQVRGQS